ncbi:MAG: hypothetical protein OEU50_11745 [Gammaproteobacteria bacterium]|nr:hypothetical protein [Gammaproteobacteria bacterium]
MPANIQLVLPGLFDLPLSELSPRLLSEQLPALNRILRLANTRANSAFTIDAMLRQLLALDSSAAETASSLPLAQAYAAPERRKSNRQLLFRAVHLRPDLHNAIIVPISHDREDLHDIIILINDLYDIFNVDCDISAIDEGMFLMDLKAFEAPAHYPHILSVLGKPANPYIEQSRQHLQWYKLLNEMQMFLHAHDLNRDRERRGRLAINSLWFWGGGRVPDNVDSRLAWYCDDPVLSRFATSLGLTTASLEQLSEPVDAAAVAVVDLRLLELLKSGVATDFGDLLLDIEHSLLQPLLKAIDRERKDLRLRLGHDSDLQMTPVSALKFWRRPRSLADWPSAIDNG